MRWSRSSTGGLDGSLAIEITLSPLHRVIWSLLIVFVSTLLTASQVTRAVSPTDPVPYEALPIDVSVETVVPTANQLVAMAFTPDGRLLYTEKTGAVRVVANGALLPTPAYTFRLCKYRRRARPIGHSR